MRERWEQSLLEEQEEEGPGPQPPGPHHRASFGAENARQPVTGGGLKIARAAQTGLPPGPRAESSEAVGGRAGGLPAE